MAWLYGVWLFLREGIRWLDVGLLVGMYLLTMTGVELGLHRTPRRSDGAGGPCLP